MNAAANDIGVIGVLSDDAGYALTVDDIRRILVFAPLVAMGAHGEVQGEKRDFGKRVLGCRLPNYQGRSSSLRPEPLNLFMRI